MNVPKHATNGDMPPTYEVTMREKGRDVALSLHPLATHQGMFVKIVPPDRPSGASRAPVDVVLVLDVSTSMSEAAAMPRGPSGEKLAENGFSILDLTKHAANAVLENLDDHDRLSIVTFSTTAHTVQSLCSMTKPNKELARDRITSLVTGGCTNLWGGIRQALAEFNESRDLGNVRTALILTDGRPYGHGSSPSVGWAKAFEKLGRLPASIHTFGFGYDLQDGLLQTIAELGGGNYSFISDIGMIGTTFSHSIANIQCTFAEDVLVTLRCPGRVGLEESWLRIGQEDRELLDGDADFTFKLNSVQYGQTRHVYLWYQCGYQQMQSYLEDEKGGRIEAELSFKHQGALQTQSSSVLLNPKVATGMTDKDIAYHLSRAQAIRFLSRLFPLDPASGEHKSISAAMLPRARESLSQLLRDMPGTSPAYRKEPRCQALVADFHIPPENKGQVEQALNAADFQRWGRFYLPSLLCAYVNQTRLSFKEPGTKCFGGSLFSERVDAISDAFDNLPPPAPSIRQWAPPGRTANARNYSMRLLNNSNNDCFAGSTCVLLGDGRNTCMHDLRPGMEVQTLCGARMVKNVIKCHTDQRVGRTMCKIAQKSGRTLVVTPWHPISMDGGISWIFPAWLTGDDSLYTAEIIDRFLEDVYSVLLESDIADENPDSCSLMVDGAWGLTLGHGLTMDNMSGEVDVRNHPFYGDYDAVVHALETIPVDAEGFKLVQGSGGPRDEVTGLVKGYKAFDHVAVAHL